MQRHGGYIEKIWIMINPGIIVQARMQSSRLRGKVLLDFYQDKNILEILIDNLKSKTNLPVIIATTDEKHDDAIENLCKKNNYTCFRGSEENVLLRFVEAAKKHSLTHVIRVCSDNPFILPEYINKLASEAKNNPYADYISFKIKDKPSILTHFGLWGELAKLEALEIALSQSQKQYNEHVTNYLYHNPEIFNLHWIDLSNEMEGLEHLRLTVDQQEDFDNALKVITTTGLDFTFDSILEVYRSDLHLQELMRKQIDRNLK
jgi:spore coat polysaccharide biosynthesis protein SpsF